MNTAYITWSASAATAAEVYARTLATGEFTEQTGNALGLKNYLHSQADAEKDWHLATTTARTTDITRVVTATPDAFSNPNYNNNVWTLPAADRLNDFYLRDYGYGWGVDYSGRNAAAADYTQDTVPSDSQRRIGVMDRRFDGLHATKTAEQVYQESLQNAEQIYIAAEGAANVTRAASVATANAQSAADNAASWATKLDPFTTSSNPWLSYAAASADVEAAYLTTLVTPTGTLQAALATAETNYAKTISQSRFIGTQQTFYQRWAEDLNTTYYSFNNPNTYYGHYRTEAFTALHQILTTNLNPPSTEQAGNQQSPPASNSAAASLLSLLLPAVSRGASLLNVFPLLSAPGSQPTFGVSDAPKPLGTSGEKPEATTLLDNQPTTTQLTDLKDGTHRLPHRIQPLSSSGPVADVMGINLDLEVPAPTNFQELYNKHKQRLVNLDGRDGIEFIKGTYEGFRDSVLDTLQMIRSIAEFSATWGAYATSELDWRAAIARKAITAATGVDPFAAQVRTIEWLQQMLASAGNTMSPSQIAEFAAKNAISLQRNLNAYAQQLGQTAAQIQIFLDQHGQELAAAIENRDLDEIARLKQYLPKELQGSLDFVYSTAIQLLDDLADSVTPRNLGYLTGMLLYEFAEDAAITAAWSAFTVTTLGAGVTSAPALAASKAAIFLRRFEAKIGKMPDGIKQKVLKTLSDAIWSVAKRFEICFVAGTLVHTERGLRPIEEVVQDDFVFSRSEYDPHGAVRLRRVKQTFVTHPTRLYHVTYRTADGREETLSGTGEHPYFVVGKGFVPAKELVEGDELSLINGVQAFVDGLGTEDAAAGEQFTTYNFEVEEDHTYFVGDLGVWVHNAGTICGEAVDSLMRRSPQELAELAADSNKLRAAARESLEAAKQEAIKDAAGNAEALDWIEKEFKVHEDDVVSSAQKRIAEQLASDAWVRPKGWRLPKNGGWDGTPGNSNFKPHNPSDLGLKPDEVIPFRHGRPDFSAFSKGNYTTKVPLTGNHAIDEPRMIAALAEAKGWSTSFTREWLRTNQYVLHHAGGDNFQVLEGRLHGATAWGYNGIRHMGGAFDLRNQ